MRLEHLVQQTNPIQQAQLKNQIQELIICMIEILRNEGCIKQMIN